MSAGLNADDAPQNASARAVASQGPPPTVAWFHCFAGIAGDMALGSLIDAGADFSELQAMLERLLREEDSRRTPTPLKGEDR